MNESNENESIKWVNQLVIEWVNEWVKWDWVNQMSQSISNWMSQWMSQICYYDDDQLIMNGS